MQPTTPATPRCSSGGRPGSTQRFPLSFLAEFQEDPERPGPVLRMVPLMLLPQALALGGPELLGFTSLAGVGWGCGFN